MKPVGLFIFDLDGTLANTIEDITASVNYTLTRLGRKPIPLEAVRRYVGDGITMLLTRALNEETEFLRDAAGIYSVHQSQNLVVRTRLYPGVAETLEHFRAVPMAVITNKTRDFSEPILDQLGVRKYFRMIIGADDGLPLKPEPDSVLKVVETIGAPKDRTVIVGDGTTDMKAGKAAGIATCAVTYGFRSEEELRKAGPDDVIHDFSELKKLFSPAAP